MATKLHLIYTYRNEFEESYFVFENHQRPTLSVKGLKYNTDYRWRVIARDENGNITEGPTWTFTTEKIYTSNTN